MPFPLPQASFACLRNVLEAGYISDKKVISVLEWNSLTGKNYIREIYGLIAFFQELHWVEVSSLICKSTKDHVWEEHQ